MQDLGPGSPSGLGACAPSPQVLSRLERDKTFKYTGGNEEDVVSPGGKRDPLEPDRKPGLYREKQGGFRPAPPQPFVLKTTTSITDHLERLVTISPHLLSLHLAHTCWVAMVVGGCGHGDMVLFPPKAPRPKDRHIVLHQYHTEENRQEVSKTY